MARATISDDFGLRGERASRTTGAFRNAVEALTRRLNDALEAQSQSVFEVTLAEAMVRSGGRLTDSMERDAMRAVSEPRSGLAV